MAVGVFGIAVGGFSGGLVAKTVGGGFSSSGPACGSASSLSQAAIKPPIPVKLKPVTNVALRKSLLVKFVWISGEIGSLIMLLFLVNATLIEFNCQYYRMFDCQMWCVVDVYRNSLICRVFVSKEDFSRKFVFNKYLLDYRPVRFWESRPRRINHNQSIVGIK